MENYILHDDVVLFGIQVKTFPLGIKEAFDELSKHVGSNRSFYGISWCAETDQIEYYAMAPETFAGESEQYNFTTCRVPKGTYRTVTVQDWMDKTGSIKDVFHGLMGTDRPDASHPCVEWYKSDEEMICMVRNA